MSGVHISLRVSDLAKSVDFYRGLFGEPRKRKADYAKFVGRDPEIHLALQPRRSGTPSSEALSHLGLRVESIDEVRRWRKEVESRGIVSEEEKREACCYAVQEKFWVTDPDGIRWEVYTVLEDIEEETRQASEACCP